MQDVCAELLADLRGELVDVLIWFVIAQLMQRQKDETVAAVRTL